MKVQTAFRLEPAILDALREISKDGRPMGWHVDKALNDYLGRPADKPIVKAKKAPAAKFIPPAVDEVRDYCLQRGNGIDPETFVSHYRANGWKRGNTPIKDWKACVITWEKRNKEKAAGNGKQSLSQRSQSATERALAQVQGVGDNFLGSDDTPFRLQMD